jgi:hypothetical protein
LLLGDNPTKPMDNEQRLLNRITQLENKNLELKSQISTVVATANNRVNELQSHLQAQIDDLKAKYDKVQLKLTELAKKAG